jgi:hypothetical protein
MMQPARTLPRATVNFSWTSWSTGPSPESDDLSFTINLTYQYRPDLLAHDLYGDARLWWVFYQRNPNTLTKPPLDFVTDTQILLPKITTLKSVLGF